MLQLGEKGRVFLRFGLTNDDDLFAVQRLIDAGRDWRGLMRLLPLPRLLADPRLPPLMCSGGAEAERCGLWGPA